MTVDVSTFVGPYPFRHLAGPSPGGLLREMDRVGIEQAWVGHLPSAFYRDPAPGTGELLSLLAPHRDRLFPVPAVHPGLPHWEDDLGAAADAGAPAVRGYPGQQGLAPDGPEMRALVVAAAERRLPVLLTVRFEDLRQRHPLDAAPDLPPWAVRALARLAPAARLLVTHADRSFVEEVHFGLTPDEARRVLWELSWIWGPPDDHLALLQQTVGPERFTFGSGWPLRLAEGAVAKLDLLAPDPSVRANLTAANLQRWRK